jgi:hypothetical protein
MNYSTLDIVVVLVLLIITNAITGLVVQNTADSNWQKQCNERNVSGYNPVSGKWEWKSPKITVVEDRSTQLPLLAAPTDRRDRE